MSNKLIQWPKAKYWTKCWNFVTGCYPESEGCANCWAKRTVERFEINGGKFEPVFKQTSWPPRSGVVFIGNMSDVFGDWVDSLDLYVHFTSLSKKAINLILTKRAARLNYFTNHWQHQPETGHMWFGITAENQQRLNERYKHLQQANVIHRWLSLEPLLGAIDLAECLPARDDNGYQVNQLTAKNVNWVVVGHESGHNRRPGNIDDVRAIVKQCVVAGVPVFVKQLDLGGKDVEKDINKFPEDLRIRQTPWITINFRIEL